MNHPSYTGRVIDAHVHVHPDRAAPLRDLMDANGLDRVVNLGVLERFGIPFAEGLRAFRKALGDRVITFATPDFADTAPGFGERMADDLERKVEAGARGLKIFKELGLRHRDQDGALIPVDDPRLDPLWSRAGALGVPVLIHTADPVAFFLPLNPDNERWDELQLRPDWYFGTPEFPDHDTLLAQRNRVIARHPHTAFIGAHLGNYPENLAYVDDCLARFPNFSVDVWARLGEIGRHPAEEVRAFFLKHQDRVIFGTDLTLGFSASHPENDADPAEIAEFYDGHWRFFETAERGIEYPGFPVQGRWHVDAIDLPPEALEKLYARNLQRLVPGLEGA
jgi:predicted TIM-barrel fold metal-dependent hydrolase